MESCSRKFLVALLLPIVVFIWEEFGLFQYVEAGCPFQNPFWFVEKPEVVSVFDENGEMVPNKIRVMWGRMENFKCVDYFQVIISLILIYWGPKERSEQGHHFILCCLGFLQPK